MFKQNFQRGPINDKWSLRGKCNLFVLFIIKNVTINYHSLDNILFLFLNIYMVVPQGFQYNIALQSQRVWQYGFQIGSHWNFLMLSLFGFPSCCIQTQNCLQVLNVSELLYKADVWLLPPLLIRLIFVMSKYGWDCINL